MLQTFTVTTQKVKLSLLAVVAALAILPATATAQQVLPKNGFCPSGYSGKGNYCVPGKNAKEAFAKNGFCPSGYHGSGNYCVKNR